METRPTRDSIRLAADRLQGVVRETPVEVSPSLSAECGVEVCLKLESFQRTGSFKLRGATHKILRLREERGASVAGVVAASAGNHGLGVACAARETDVEAEIFLPEGTAASTAEAIREYGARVTFHGTDCLETETAARRAAEASGRVYVSPYNDLDVIEGQGTIAVELERDLETFDAIFIAAGGGGLLAGVGAYTETMRAQPKVIACSPSSSPVLHDSMAAGKIVESRVLPTLSHSTAGGIEPDSITLPICSAVVDESLLVSEDEIARALRHAIERERVLVEGAAAVAIAGCRSWLRLPRPEVARVVVLVCGANLSWEELTSVSRGIASE